VVGFTSGSRGKVPGENCEKRINNNNHNVQLLNFFALKKHERSGDKAPHILNLGTGWRRMMTFTLQQLLEKETLDTTHTI
jgi:hypothetical protein